MGRYRKPRTSAIFSKRLAVKRPDVCLLIQQSMQALEDAWKSLGKETVKKLCPNWKELKTQTTHVIEAVANCGVKLQRALVTPKEAKLFMKDYADFYVKDTAGGVLIHPKADLFFEGWENANGIDTVDLEEHNPLPSPSLAPVKVGQKVTSLLKGEEFEGRHIGRGCVMSEERYEVVVEALKNAWPWNYRASGGINSKDPRHEKHRLAYDLLIKEVWPAGTEEKYYGIVGFPHRASFHTERVLVCVEFLKHVWVHCCGLEPKNFHTRYVENFVVARLRRQHDARVTLFEKNNAKSTSWLSAFRDQFKHEQFRFNRKFAETLFNLSSDDTTENSELSDVVEPEHHLR